MTKHLERVSLVEVGAFFERRSAGSSECKAVVRQRFAMRAEPGGLFRRQRREVEERGGVAGGIRVVRETADVGLT